MNFPNRVSGSLPVPATAVDDRVIFANIERCLSRKGAFIRSHYPQPLEFRAARRWDGMAWFNVPATGDGRVWIDSRAPQRVLFYNVDFTAKAVFATVSSAVLPSSLGYLSHNLAVGMIIGAIACIVWTIFYWVYANSATQRFLWDALRSAPTNAQSEGVDPSVR
jgi:hypothetical protein